MTPETGGAVSLTAAKNMITGMAAAGAKASGWSTEQAIFMAMKAQQGAVSRISAGEAAIDAFTAAVAEAELVVMLDVFCQTLDETRDAWKAFHKALEVKRLATAGAPGADKAFEAAETAFRDALETGLSPQAAFASAHSAGAAVARLAGASKH